MDQAGDGMDTLLRTHISGLALLLIAKDVRYKTCLWIKKRVLLLDNVLRFNLAEALGRMVPKFAYPIVSHDLVREVLGPKCLVNCLVYIQGVREK